MRRSDEGPTFGEWLADRMRSHGFLTDQALADVTGIDGATFSRWRRDTGSQPMPAQLRRIVEPLRAPMLELLVRTGHITQEEARLKDVVSLPPPAIVTARDVLEADADLSDEARAIVLAAYDAARQTPARARLRIAQKPTAKSARPRSARVAPESP